MVEKPEIIKIEIVEPAHDTLPVLKQEPSKDIAVMQVGGGFGGGHNHTSGKNPVKKYSFFASAFLPVLTGVIFAGLFSFGVYVFANPPGSPYAPPAPLDPGCGPTDTNCSVLPPVPYTGATAALNLGAQNFTTNGVGKFGFDASNYATLTTASNGDLTVATTSSTTGGNINLNSAVTGDATILGSSGTLIIGGTSLTNNENLKFDFETSANKVAVTSSTGVATLDLGSFNLVTTGGLTLGGSTTGTLVTRVKAGAATESDTDGALVVDSTNGRLYFRYSGAWHYIDKTAGFGIPNFETVDPISGDQMKEGDIVLGIINGTFEDSALHGVWVKWDSVKAELIQEIQAAGGISPGSSIGAGSASGASSDFLLDKVKNVLVSLGISIKDGVSSMVNLVTEKFSAKTARIENLEMVDKATGDIYCTWIKNGQWEKAKGECSSIDVAIADSNLSLQANQAVLQAAQQAARQAGNQVTQQLQSQIQGEIQSEVQIQLDAQQTPPATEPASTSPAETPTAETAPAEQPTIFDIVSSAIPMSYRDVVILFVIDTAFVIVLALCILLFFANLILRKMRMRKMNKGIRKEP